MSEGEPNFYGESIEEKESNATLDLADLGLHWEDLKDKSVLDVGAGLAQIAEVGKQKDVNVVSVDNNPEMWMHMGKILPDVPYIKAETTKLPFEDNSLDLIVSHGGPPNIVKTKQDVIDTIKEFERVLKEGGEARFGCGDLNAEVFGFTQEEENSFTDEQKKEIREKSLAFLQTINKNISQEVTHEGRILDAATMGNLFYKFKK